MFGWKSAAAVAATAILALSGCSSGGGNDGGETGGTLTLGAIVPVSTFAAKDAVWANESPYMQAVYDTLLKANPEGKVEPNLATEWEWNEERTVLTMTLRDDVTFTDGKPLTADAAAQSLLAFRDGTSPNKSNLKNVTDATAVDETTLRITLSQPDPALEVYLTQNSGLVESPAALTAPDVDTVPVGSGPYTLNAADTVIGSTYVFDAKEDYWNPDNQHYDRVVINVYSDPSSLINTIQGGKLNGAYVADFNTLPQAEAAGYTVNKTAINWFGLLLSDREGTLTPALGDVRVRQAINYAMDRDALLQGLIAGNGKTTTQIFPQYSPSFDEGLDSFYEYDLDKAKELMKEAGYADGFTLSMARTSVLPAANFTLISEQLAQIGITVRYEDLVPNEYLGRIVDGRYSVAAFNLQQDPTDWQLAQFQIAAASTWNTFHVEDPTVQELIAQMQTGDQAQAAEAGKELNRYLVENAWFAPFYRPTASFVSDANTEVQMQTGNIYPYLYNIQPK